MARELVLLTSRDGSHLNQNAANPAGPSQTSGMNAIAGRPAGSNSGSRVLGSAPAGAPLSGQESLPSPHRAKKQTQSRRTSPSRGSSRFPRFASPWKATSCRDHLLAGFAPMLCLNGRQDLSALIKRIATSTGIESIGISVCKRLSRRAS